MKTPQSTHIIITVALFLISASLGGSTYYFFVQNKNLEQEYNNYQTVTQDEILIKDATIKELGDKLEMTSEELSNTENNLRSEKERNDEMNEQISQIAGTVSDLDKLSKTDKELLKKYSKVYFLNENYIPEALSQIDNEWKYTESKNLELHSKVMPFFEKMEDAAKKDAVDLWVVSAYRSFGTQASLKGAYLTTYGSGANAFSADQGFSEHQLGTTVDFTTKGLGGGLAGFDDTPAFKWLQENAYKYGFILSYSHNNTYYIYEPWHWRFVGRDLARYMHNEKLNFYDIDQRVIDGYLLHIFD